MKKTWHLRTTAPSLNTRTVTCHNILTFWDALWEKKTTMFIISVFIIIYCRKQWYRKKIFLKIRKNNERVTRSTKSTGDRKLNAKSTKRWLSLSLRLSFQVKSERILKSSPSEFYFLKLNKKAENAKCLKMGWSSSSVQADTHFNWSLKWF